MTLDGLTPRFETPAHGARSQAAARSTAGTAVPTGRPGLPANGRLALAERGPLNGDKRQVIIRLGTLAYAGTATRGKQLHFDGRWGTWSEGRPPRRHLAFAWLAGYPSRLRWGLLCGALAVAFAFAWAVWMGRAVSQTDPGHGNLLHGEDGRLSAITPLISVPEWLAATMSSAPSVQALPSAGIALFGSLAPDRALETKTPSLADFAGEAKIPLPASRRAELPKPPARRPASSPQRRVLAATSNIREFIAPALEPLSDRLVAILDETTVVVPNPLGVPTPVRLGQRLPSGATLLQVNPQTGTAVTTVGALALEVQGPHAP